MRLDSVTILTIAFILLKLTDAIDWSWWWVFSPLWITASIYFIFIVVGSLAMSLIAFMGTKNNKDEQYDDAEQDDN